MKKLTNLRRKYCKSNADVTMTRDSCVVHTQVVRVSVAQSDCTRNDADILTCVIGARVRTNGGGGQKCFVCLFV